MSKLREAAEAGVVALAMTGDGPAFEELVRRRQGSVRGLLRRFCGQPALADDLAQQVFVTAWQKLPALREPAAFGGWLRQIVVNTWLMHRRSPDGARPFAPLESAPEPSATPDPGAGIDLERALAGMRDEERIAVVLAYAEGLTHPEIAALTGWPLGTAKSHVTRGAAQLRERLGKGSIR